MAVLFCIVHLPNYDTYNTFSPSTRISSAAEAAQNTREVHATMKLVENANCNLNDLRNGFQTTDQRRETETSKQQATLGRFKADSIMADLQQLGNNLAKLGADQNDSALRKAGTDVAPLGNSSAKREVRRNA